MTPLNNHLLLLYSVHCNFLCASRLFYILFTCLGCVEIAPIPDVSTGSTPHTPGTPVIDLPSGSLMSNPQSQSQTVPNVIDANLLRTRDGVQMAHLLLQNANFSPDLFLGWLKEFAEFLDRNRESLIPDVIYFEGERDGIPVEVSMTYNTS